MIEKLNLADFDAYQELPCGCCYMLIKRHPRERRVKSITYITEKKITDNMKRMGIKLKVNQLKIDASECCQ